MKTTAEDINVQMQIVPIEADMTMAGKKRVTV